MQSGKSEPQSDFATSVNNYERQSVFACRRSADDDISVSREDNQQTPMRFIWTTSQPSRRQMPVVTTTTAGATAERRAHHYYAQVYRDTRRPQCQSDAKLTSSLGAAATYATLSGCRAPDCSCCSGLLSQLHPHRRGGHHDTERQCLHLAARSGLGHRIGYSVTPRLQPGTPIRPSTLRAPEHRRRKTWRCWRTCEAARIDNELPTCT